MPSAGTSVLGPRLTRSQIAARAAADIPEGWYVNLGIGIPTSIPDAMPAGREVVFHSENGALGVGPKPHPDMVEPWLINASKEQITLLRGAALMDHAASFALIRGRHLDLCVLGAFEVSATGDVANWKLDGEGAVPAVGGAMDLVAGAKRIWVLMEHTTKDGKPRIVEQCRHPLTAERVVTRIYTDLAVLQVEDGRLRVIDLTPGWTFAALQDVTDAPLVL